MNCFECGSAESLHAHHVVPRSKGGTKTVDLCSACHAKVHGRNLLTTSTLTKQALDKRRAAGLAVSPTPHGYRRIGDRIVEDERGQEMIRKAKEFRSAGNSLRLVALKLEQLGFTNVHGRPFNQKSVTSMISRGAA
jgi:hypothetical protein